MSYNGAKIPKIIHQTWKDLDVPKHLIPLIDTWKCQHPDWEYMLWTDEMNLNFIKKYHPGFLPCYENLPFNIQRVDAVRYFILYELGGVFIDMDFECLKNIEPILQNQTCVFGIEPLQHCERHDKKLIVCNAFMACTRKNNFFKEICEALAKTVVVPSNKPQWLQVLESTGPFKLTEIYYGYQIKETITLLSAETVYPLSLAETRQLIDDGEIACDIEAKTKNSYAIHYFLGSWW